MIFNQTFSAHPRQFQPRNGNIARGIPRRKPSGWERPELQRARHCPSTKAAARALPALPGAHNSDSEVVRPDRQARHSPMPCQSPPSDSPGRAIVTGNRRAPRSDLLSSSRICRLLCLGRHLAPAHSGLASLLRLYHSSPDHQHPDWGPLASGSGMTIYLWSVTTSNTLYRIRWKLVEPLS